MKSLVILKVSLNRFATLLAVKNLSTLVAHNLFHSSAFSLELSIFDGSKIVLTIVKQV